MTMTTEEFRKAILEGIPEKLPEPKAYDESINHAPKRKDILSDKEKALALKNALRYFHPRHHAVLVTAASTCTASARITRCTPGT